jgi:hypothetical protein
MSIFFFKRILDTSNNKRLLIKVMSENESEPYADEEELE